MDTPPNRTRRRLVERSLSASPVPAAPADDGPGTPGPTRVRIGNLEKQVQELVRRYQAEQRKVEANARERERLADEWADERALLAYQLEGEGVRAARARAAAEISRVQSEANRDEVRLLSSAAAQKAALAAADDQWALLEVEMAAQVAGTQRLTHEHALELAESRAADATDAAAGKEARIAALEAKLEAANTSLAHQRVAESRARVSNERDGAALTALEGELAQKGEAAAALEVQLAHQAEAAAALKTKLGELRAKLTDAEQAHRDLAGKEADARAEIQRLQQATSSHDAQDGEEVATLRAELRTARAEASKHEKAAEAAREEADDTKAEYKEVLRSLKDKYRAAKAETARLAGVEEELEALKAVPKKAPRKKAGTGVAAGDTPEKPRRKKKSAAAAPAIESPASDRVGRTRKSSPVEVSEDEAPKKKARKSKPKPLQEADDNAASPPVKARKTRTPVPAGSEDEAADPVPAPAKKKKKRILGGAAPAFTWDPILNSGDGVIPSFLSPVSGRSGSGTIPRAGFGALSARSTRF